MTGYGFIPGDTLMRTLAGALVGAAVVTAGVGCGTGGSDVAVPTDGPNQVVLKVPAMT